MPSAVEPEGTFDGLSASAILLGALVDLAATTIVVSALALWLAPDVTSRDPGVASKAFEAYRATPTYVTMNVAVGALGTVVGAFVGARRAGQLHVRHGGWIAVTSTAIGVLLGVLSATPPAETSTPLWAEALAWLLILPAGMTGGAIAAALPARKREP